MKVNKMQPGGGKFYKGFTLIELLAVIVILAVVALVATPIIMTSVKNAKMSAANSSALGYIDGVNKSLELNAFEKGETKYALYTLDDVNTILSDNIKIQGNTPTDAIIYVSDNNVVNANICIDGYNVIYNGDSSEVVGECNTLYKETVLNGAYPVYSSNLIPVTIDNGKEEDNYATAGKVYKANISSEWYNYNNKQWANAVILKESVKDKYKDKPSGTEISLSDIESYFVWIPKYSYRLFSVTKYTSVISEKPTTSIGADTIDIRFGTNNTSDTDDTCATPMLSGEIGECEKDKYMTHPAFISMNTNGFWVGKFETTGSTINLSILPGETSLRGTTSNPLPVKTMFELCYNYKRNNDSHMMKNTEWGAVAYLSHSLYGIGTEVRINNNRDNKTGYAAANGVKEDCYGSSDCAVIGYTSETGKTQPYNTTDGYTASTTGNISGIYDMSGGAHEYMSAYIVDTYVSSGFDASTISKYNKKYFDVYKSNSIYSSYANMILGDATGEIGPFYDYVDKDKNTTNGNYNSRYHNNWYADHSYFVISSYSWFHRGGTYYTGVAAGQFYFNKDSGGSFSTVGFRLVLNH